MWHRCVKRRWKEPDMSIIGEASQTGLITNVSRTRARIQCDEKLGEAHIHVGLSFSFLAHPGDHDVRNRDQMHDPQHHGKQRKFTAQSVPTNTACNSTASIARSKSCCKTLSVRRYSAAAKRLDNCARCIGTARVGGMLPRWQRSLMLWPAYSSSP